MPFKITKKSLKPSGKSEKPKSQASAKRDGKPSSKRDVRPFKKRDGKTLVKRVARPEAKRLVKPKEVAVEKPAEKRGLKRTGKAGKNSFVKPVSKRIANMFAKAPLQPLAKPAANSEEIIAAEAMHAKKAVDIVVMDVRNVTGVCDKVVIASATSSTHLVTVAEAAEEALRKAGAKCIHRDGLRAAEPNWVLLDYGDLMVHVFHSRTRAEYQIEEFFREAQVLARYE